MKTKKSLLSLSLCAFFLMMPYSANAGIFGKLKDIFKAIVDQSGFTRSILGKSVDQLDQIKKEVSIAQDTYKQAKGQLDTLNDLKKMGQKHYGWGDLLNGTEDLKKLQYTADSWDMTLTQTSRNSKRYQAILEHYTKQHEDIKEATYKEVAGEEAYSKYKKAKLITANADTQATAAFDDTNARLKRIHKLSKSIEKTKSPKSAQDLNSRLIAENANVQAEILRQLAILNKQSALQSERRYQEEANRIKEELKEKEFNRMPDG